MIFLIADLVTNDQRYVIHTIYAICTYIGNKETDA